jgi:hypothetical protein
MIPAVLPIWAIADADIGAAWLEAFDNYYQRNRVPSIVLASRDLLEAALRRHNLLTVVGVAEAAERYGVSRAAITARCRSGSFPGAYKARGQWRIPLTD